MTEPPLKKEFGQNVGRNDFLVAKLKERSKKTGSGQQCGMLLRSQMRQERKKKFRLNNTECAGYFIWSSFDRSLGPKPDWHGLRGERKVREEIQAEKTSPSNIQIL